MGRNQIVLALAAATHLSLIVCGATRIRIPNNTLIGRGVTQYRALTGADQAFGFFAPGVASQLRVECVVRDSTGRTDHCELSEMVGGNREVALRSTVSYAAFAWAADNARERIAASWARNVARRYPHATHIELSLESFHLPKMSGYRDGECPQWKTRYRIGFEPRSAEESR